MTVRQVGLVLCQGCGIGEGLDLGALEQVARKGEGVMHVARVAMACDECGGRALDAAVAAGAQAVVVAACSGRFHARAFLRAGCHTERVGLRELAVYSHDARHDDTQMLAEDMLRMGMARTRHMELPVPQSLQVERTVLVVGGGPSGLSAALGAARAGYDVELVEKHAQLGGWLRSWCCPRDLRIARSRTRTSTGCWRASPGSRAFAATARPAWCEPRASPASSTSS
jgi:quinone-modifying oxidoreductase subunit QmoB